jgi:hypothetical protein
MIAQAVMPQISSYWVAAYKIVIAAKAIVVFLTTGKVALDLRLSGANNAEHLAPRIAINETQGCTEASSMGYHRKFRKKLSAPHAAISFAALAVLFACLIKSAAGPSLSPPGQSSDNGCERNS